MSRTRAALAVLSLIAACHGSAPAQAQSMEAGTFFTPPPCAGPPFNDVPATDPFCPWIQQLVADQITGGCGSGNYCPGSAVTRAQMAVFLELAMRGTNTWSPFPPGAVMFFNLPACPDGWTELTSARGRYLVGVGASGSLGATTGIPLGDQENRAAGQHTHTVTDPGHTHSYVNNGIFQNYCGSNFCQTQYGASQTTGSATTGISVDAYGTVPGTNAPYIQLLVCQKS
jgi:hypothetical protein